MCALPERGTGLTTGDFTVSEGEGKEDCRPAGPWRELSIRPSGSRRALQGPFCGAPHLLRGRMRPAQEPHLGRAPTPATSSVSQYPGGNEHSVFTHSKSRFLWKTSVRVNCRSGFALSRPSPLVFILSHVWNTVCAHVLECTAILQGAPRGTALPEDRVAK